MRAATESSNVLVDSMDGVAGRLLSTTVSKAVVELLLGVLIPDVRFPWLSDSGSCSLPSRRRMAVCGADWSSVLRCWVASGGGVRGMVRRGLFGQCGVLWSEGGRLGGGSEVVVVLAEVEVGVVVVVVCGTEGLTDVCCCP